MIKPALLKTKPIHRFGRREGFALVSTVTVMILLMMIGLGIITLSSLSSKQSSQERYQKEAEANARLALTMAISQLQKYTGPDQRVTATASIFDSDPTTIEIDDVNHPHIVGAWSTVLEDGTPIIYQHSDGSHGDRRNTSDSSHIDHRENVLTWLVSGTEKSNFDPRTSTLTEGQNAIALGYDEGNAILAPLVQNKNAEGKVDGGYAYHVTDLGMAAPVVQFNKNVDAEPAAATPNDGGYANLYTGKKRQYDKISETSPLSTITDDEVVSDRDKTNRYITYRTTSLNPDGTLNNDAKTFLEDYSQNFTAENNALLVDTLRGTLKTDLTPFIKDQSPAGSGQLSGQSATLLTDETPILEHDRFKVLSPKFGILRDYLKLGQLAGSNRTLAPQIAKYGGGKLQDYPDPTKVIKAGVHPFIVEYSFFARPVINTSAGKKISLLLYPRVTLWNPYNVTLDTSGYFVQINQRSYMRMDVKESGTPGNGEEYNWTSPYWNSPLANDGAAARPAYLFFFLDPVKIEPGQSLVFTPKNTSPQQIQFRNGNIQSNILSAESDPQDLNCFYVDMGGPGAALDTNKDYQYKFKRYWDNGYHIGYEESTSARLRLSSGPTNYDSVIGGTTDAPSYPIVHTMDIHNWIRGNEGRWHDINRPWLPVLEMSTANSVPPDNRTKFGIRLKSFNETPENLSNLPNALWDYPMLELSNMRSPFYRRTPWDWIFWIPTVLHEYSFGPFASENQEQPGYLDPFMLPRYIDGVAETSPFMDNNSQSNLRYSVFDIPPANVEVFSIGQLRQTPLTHEFSAPSFIIGESLVPVTSPRDRSAFDAATYTTKWWNGYHQGRVTNYSTWWENAYDPSNNYAAYDYRYEVNHALWDKYFFSTIPSNSTLVSYTEPGSLPNPNLYVSNDAGIDLSNAQNAKADTIARSLRLHNHQSVNSTSLIAWKALLSMNMGMNINGQTTDPNAAPFPGTSHPISGGTSPTGSLNADTWTGYRQLSEQEIDSLAREIVAQVKRRAPFVSMSDFVNRRLYAATISGDAAPSITSQSDEDLLSYAGPLEIAIHKSALNAGLQDYQIKAGTEYSDSSLNSGGDGFDTINMPTERFANAPAHLTQGKVLETIGAQLTPRSDTFRIRAYGEARDNSGRVVAEAWCEAIIQRTSEYIDSKNDEATVAFDNLASETNREFGREYKIVSFRWLNNEELSND